MPAINIYRPPAARKLEQNANSPSLAGRDVQKCKCPEECEDSVQSKRNENSGISMFRNAISSIRTQNQVPKCRVADKNEANMKSAKQDDSSKNHIRQRRPDMQVYVPKGRRIADQSKTQVPKNPEPEMLIRTQSDSDSDGTSRVKNKIECEVPCAKSEDESPVSHTSLWIEAQNEVKSEPDVKAVLSSQPYEDSDSTAISSSSDNSSSNSLRNSCEKISEIKEVKEAKDAKEKEVKEVKSTKKESSAHLDPEECDWETMFDDSGECLDPSLLEQLSNTVGHVAIEKPKSNYDEYKTKSLDMVADEFPHVIEIYNFPPEFQEQDLITVFSQFKNSGFEIKWVDSTHALGIFSSSKVVTEVLAFHHPFVKTRSLKEGTPLSKTKARKSPELLLPYKPRPDTCPALARRLVTGALGVRLPSLKAEREAEKKLLTKAREKKRLEAKQKEEAWEGNFS